MVQGKRELDDYVVIEGGRWRRVAGATWAARLMKLKHVGVVSRNVELTWRMFMDVYWPIEINELMK